MSKELGPFGRGLRRVAPAAAIAVGFLLARDAGASGVVRNQNLQPGPTAIASPTIELTPTAIPTVVIPVEGLQATPSPQHLPVLPILPPAIGVFEGERASDILSEAFGINIKCRTYPTLEAELKDRARELSIVTWVRKLLYQGNADVKAAQAAEKGDLRETSRQLLILRKGDDQKREILLKAYQSYLERGLAVDSSNPRDLLAKGLDNICLLDRIQDLEYEIKSSKTGKN